jgi:subfamily B ATP-binding cassette protein MsbA
MKQVFRNIRSSFSIATRIFLMMNRKEKVLFFLFVTSAVLSAVSEGAGIGLFAQILSAQMNGNVFSDVPVLGNIEFLFEGLDVKERIERVAILLIFVVLARASLQYVVYAIGAILPIDLMKRMKLVAFNKLQAASYAYMQSRNIGGINTDIIMTTKNVHIWVQHIGHVMSNIILLLFYAFILIALSPVITFFVILGMLIGSFVLKWLTEEKAKAAMQETLDADEVSISVLSSSSEGAKLVRLMNGQNVVKSKWKQSVDSYAEALFKQSLLTSIPYPFMMCYVGLLGGAGIWFMLLFSTSDPANWIVLILLFLAILLRMQGPVSVLNSSLNYIVTYSPALTQYDNFIKSVSEEVETGGGKDIVSFDNSIELKNVNFSYDGTNAHTVEGVSFSIPKGSFCAIVGSSGAGKTTIASLICRLYEPQEGSMFVDGQDLTKVNLESWRNLISVVSQDVFLFDDNLIENIRFAKDRSEEEVIEAAKIASAHDFISQLPNGYHTVIGERGTRLSGGQKQRIALARAVLADTPILILDEATSQLDSETENLIQQTIFELSKSRTIIAIAHRFSTIQHADNVIVMQNGRVKETGTHEQLMKCDGVYARLRKLQEFTN